MCFFPLVPFPVDDAIQAIASFICTAGQSASSFSASVSRITLPVFQKAELKGERELLSGRGALVFSAPCPVVCTARQGAALHCSVRPVLLSLRSASRYWSLAYWADIQNQLPTSPSWCSWPVPDMQVNLFESGYLNL